MEIWYAKKKYCTFATSARKIAGSVPEKSVGEPINNLPFSVINVVILACGLNGHLATPLCNFVIFKLSIWANKTRKLKICYFNAWPNWWPIIKGGD